MQQRGQGKSSHLARRCKNQETAPDRFEKQRKKLSGNPSISKQKPHSFLEDSSDDEDKPTDFELLLSTFRPLTKKPRLIADEREKIEGTLRSASAGGSQDSMAVEGGRERVEDSINVTTTASDDANGDSCSVDGEVADDCNGGDAAGRGEVGPTKFVVYRLII